MSWLLPLYIAATVFGLGVTVVDMLGALGSRGESEGSGDEPGGESADGAPDADGFGATESGHDAADAEVDGDAEGDSADGGEEDGGGEQAESESDSAEEAEGGGDDQAISHGEHVSLLAHDRRQRSTPLLKLMSAARSVVYFSLGFGPVGVFATAVQGERALISLAWSVPVGLVVMIGARLVRRLMRQELDSQLKGQDFIMEKGTVTVSIGAGQMGKVKVQVGGMYADRFARAKDPGAGIAVGTVVRVVDVTDDCIFVEREEEL